MTSQSPQAPPPTAFAPLPSKRFGVYVHIPFCASKCPYCDFASRPLAEYPAGLRERVLAGLRREPELALDVFPSLTGRAVDSVYFGGGTPSLLTPAEVSGLLEAVFAHMPRAGDCEITLEANPGFGLLDRLEGYRDAGVNRISLGVQSFQPWALQTLGRGHGVEEARDALCALRQGNFASWGMDLIFGVPSPAESCIDGDLLAAWRRDLEEAVSLQPPHLSIYGLTIHEETPFHELQQRGRLRLPGEETQREMFLTARRMLTNAGWRHYEISNYARPGHESRHNSLYWTGAQYLGLGPAAHSLTGGRRYAAPPDAVGYADAIDADQWPGVPEHPEPSPRALRGERIMLALRRLDGVAMKALEAWLGCELTTEYGERLQELQRRGLLEIAGGVIRLTEEGLLLSDSVFEAFF